MVIYYYTRKSTNPFTQHHSQLSYLSFFFKRKSQNFANLSQFFSLKLNAYLLEKPLLVTP